MANWNCRLTKGKALRKAVEENNYLDIISCLESCYYEIQEKVSEDVYDEDNLENDLWELDNLRGEVNAWNDGELDDEELSEQVDFALGEFYDLCDNLRIWVEI